MNLEQLIAFYHANSDLITPIAIGFYELLVRIVPTKRNFSILENFVKLLGVIIKNRRTPDPNDKHIGVENKASKNVVIVDRNKHIIS